MTARMTPLRFSTHTTASRMLMCSPTYSVMSSLWPNQVSIYPSPSRHLFKILLICPFGDKRASRELAGAYRSLGNTKEGCGGIDAGSTRWPHALQMRPQGRALDGEASFAMSIENHSDAPGANIHVNHYCCVPRCGKWGGFGMASAKNIETRWWCAEHYPHWEEMKARDEGRAKC